MFVNDGGMIVVPKVWGSEQVIANEEGYCGKKLFLKRGYCCSLHCHHIKDETFLVVKGMVKMEYDGKTFIMSENDRLRIQPYKLHRFSGFEDSIIFEFSTHHDDSDSYRVEESGKFLPDKKILVIGDSCQDVFVFGQCSHLSPESPVPVFKEKRRRENGGMAKNVQANIEALGYHADIITNNNWQDIKKTRIVDDDTDHMFIRIDSDENVTHVPANAIQFDKLDYYDAVVIADYNKGFLHEEDVRNITNHHDMVLLDTKKKIGSWCNGVEYLKINRREYEDSKDYIDGDFGKPAIVTLGAEGCAFAGQKFPVEKVDVRDLSGAGDTFMAGFVIAMLETEDTRNALKFANKMAARVVQMKGVTTVEG